MATEKMFHTIHDIATGETIVREYTPEEYGQAIADADAWEKAEAERLAAEEAKAQAKADAIAELKALGLSDAAIEALAG